MTTPTTRKPRRAKRAKAPVKKQVQLPVIPGNVRPNVELISMQSYWQDIRNRSSIHNYEVNEAMNELRIAVKWTNARIDQLCDRIKEVAP